MSVAGVKVTKGRLRGVYGGDDMRRNIVSVLLFLSGRSSAWRSFGFVDFFFMSLSMVSIFCLSF